MCTAITSNHYFGRNLDLEYGYGEQVAITPRNYPLAFRNTATNLSHYALVGMAVINNDYPLYYDAVNEHGLCMAALDFPDNAFYQAPKKDGLEIAPFELILWVLSQYRTVAEARPILKKIKIADIAYGDMFPQAPLHWILSDKTGSIVLEPMSDGLHIYENSVGVLSNNPPFPYHLYHLAGYQHLSTGQQEQLLEGFSIPAYGGGMGAIGLPGDFSSGSRFVKAAFVTLNSHCDNNEISSVSQFFHLLDAVAMPRGAIRARGKDVITRYSCCCSMEQGIYYFITYENRRIRAIQLHKGNIDESKIQVFPLLDQQDISYQN